VTATPARHGPVGIEPNCGDVIGFVLAFPNEGMNVNDAIETAHAFPNAVIVPVNCDSWAHFRQDRGDLERSFAALGLGSRLRLLEPGMATTIELLQ
jgi:hypothetical protein